MVPIIISKRIVSVRLSAQAAPSGMDPVDRCTITSQDVAMFTQSPSPDPNLASMEQGSRGREFRGFTSNPRASFYLPYIL